MVRFYLSIEPNSVSLCEGLRGNGGSLQSQYILLKTLRAIADPCAQSTLACGLREETLPGKGMMHH